VKNRRSVSLGRRLVDHNDNVSSCTNGDRFAVRIASDDRLGYRGRSTTGLRVTGLFERR
jgi:hypothetical protein